jgi:hypothetical protein
MGSSPFLAGLFLSALATAAGGQDVRDLRVEHRAGQTFVTWDEASGAGVAYRVYRARARITDESSLATAELLGEVDEDSGRNRARSEVTGSEHGWVIEAGGGELGRAEGLFVHTVAEGSARSYYAVTSIENGVEDRRLKSGWNTSADAVSEGAAPPQPVLQQQDANGELWAHWVGQRDTPYQPALSLWPSRGFNFRFEPGSAAGRRGLVLGLHAAGQDYSEGWPHRFELPRDVDLLAMHDEQPFTAFSLWYGAHERFPGLPAADTRISNYTQRRVLWTLDWMAARLGAAHDPERVYVVGGSMGAIGTMLLAGAAPERFAAILCRNGLYDMEADDYRNPALIQRLYGDFALGLRTREGMPILERLRASHMASLDPAADWPVIRTISGRNDETVGWWSAVQLFAGLAAAYRPAVHYFDERTHTPLGYWADLERTLLARTCTVRRDRPALRFTRFSLDDEPGDGTRSHGDAVGTINGYADYDPTTASATASGVDLDVFLRASGALDDSPSATGWAALTPRRTKPFVLAPGERVRYALSANGKLVGEHVLRADAQGLVTTPRVPLERGLRHVRFERWSPGPANLFLGAAPLAGKYLQFIVSGAPGESWNLALGLGDASGGAFGQPGVDHAVLRGMLDGDGLAERWLRIPIDLPAGAWIWGRALTGGRLWPPVGVAVQHWP